MEWDEFFKRYGDNGIWIKEDVGLDELMNTQITFNQLYETFRDRMLVELETENGDLLFRR